MKTFKEWSYYMNLKNAYKINIVNKYLNSIKVVWEYCIKASSMSMLYHIFSSNPKSTSSSLALVHAVQSREAERLLQSWLYQRRLRAARAILKTIP